MTANLRGAEINAAWYVKSYLATLPIGTKVTVEDIAGWVETMQRDLLKVTSTEALLAEISRRTK